MELCLIVKNFSTTNGSVLPFSIAPLNPGSGILSATLQLCDVPESGLSTGHMRSTSYISYIYAFHCLSFVHVGIQSVITMEVEALGFSLRRDGLQTRYPESGRLGRSWQILADGWCHALRSGGERVAHVALRLCCLCFNRFNRFLPSKIFSRAESCDADAAQELFESTT